MTWNPSIPDTATSPGQLPTTASVNWTRLQNIIEADHEFPFTAAGTQGYHKVVRWMNQTGAMAAIPGVGQSYTRSATGPNGSSTEHLAYVAGTNTTAYPECLLTMFPVRAAAIFPANNGAALPQTLTPVGTVYNVGTITRTAVQTYTVVFPANVFDAAFNPAFYFPVIMIADTSTNISATIVSMTPTLLTFRIDDSPSLTSQIRLLVFGG